MKQLSKLKILWYHLYPGILLTGFFIVFAPLFYKEGIPPQLIILLGIPIVIIPTIYFHLVKVKKIENRDRITELIVYNEKLSKIKLIGYTLGLILFAFVVYGLTQPINSIITKNLLNWLPDWYRIQDFQGYSKNIIVITLVLNLSLNGFLAPFAEEVYFRGYLLPRMESWGKLAPLFSALLFSIYHFWQPQIYLTLIISLLPMIYLTWKTKNLRLAIYTHCGLNLVGALLSFAMINQ